jgi:hypothetical protein
MITIIVRRAAILGLVAALGCVTGHGAPLSSGASKDWGETLADAEAAAAQRRYADADRMLADFASRFPGTEGAIESAYWRGLIALEPANRDGSPQVAAALFETYGKAPGALPHRLEADILRHIALKLQALSPTTSVGANATSSPTVAVASGTTDHSSDLKARDTEIQRLKDELAKANDELERIKRRLTAPTKP